MKRFIPKMIIAVLAMTWNIAAVQALQSVNMERYITLNVIGGSQIQLNLAADADDTSVKIVSGSKEHTVIVDMDWTGRQEYIAETGTITVYGNISQFDCSGNTSNIIELDASRNVQLQGLFCHNNSLSHLDVSKNTELMWLYCNGNSFTSLDVSRNIKLKSLRCHNNSLSSLDVRNNTQLNVLYCFLNTLSSLDLSNNTLLTYLDCRENQLTSLDVSKNTKLILLNCRENRLTSLDLSNNTELEWLYCFDNSLTSLDVSRNTYLNSLFCYGNNFTTAALDVLYCSLPDRGGQMSGKITPVLNASSSENGNVLASNGKNAADKNWKVQYYQDEVDITDFTGTHQCGSSTGTENMRTESAFAVYPNPVKDILHITSDKPIHSIRIYNVYGAEVLHAADTDNVNVSLLSAGVYMVRVEGKVTRVIKE